MHYTMLALAIFGALVAQVPTPAHDVFAPVRFLVGEWRGEGGGHPGQATGAASFRCELEGKVMVRLSRANYPASNGCPASYHEDCLSFDMRLVS